MDCIVHGASGDAVGMWDEDDGFFYDVLRLPDGGAQRLRVRSMVGLLPLCAVTVFEGELREKYPEITERLHSFMDSRLDLVRIFTILQREAMQVDRWQPS